MLSKLGAVCKSLSKLFFLKDACLQTPGADVYRASSIHQDLFSLCTNAPRPSMKNYHNYGQPCKGEILEKLYSQVDRDVSSLIKLLKAFEDTPKGHWCLPFAGQQPLCTPHQTQSLGSSLCRSWQVLQLLSLGLLFCWQGDTTHSALHQVPREPAGSQADHPLGSWLLTLPCRSQQTAIGNILP